MLGKKGLFMQIDVENSQELLKREELGSTKPLDLQLPCVPLLAVSSQMFFFSPLNSDHLLISNLLPQFYTLLYLQQRPQGNW